jgi:hypothetical protein
MSMRRRPLVRRVANFSWRDAQQPARAGWMRGVRDHHGRVGGQGIQQFFASGDEGFRLCFVEPAGNDFRLVIFETQTMQQRNQSRVAFIDAAKFLRAKSAGLARRTRQRRADPGFRLLLLLAVQTASAALLAKPRQSIDPVFLVSPGASPGSCRVNKENLGGLLAAPAARLAI